MKVAYKHIIEHIDPKPSISDVSEKLFQLGHEHEIKEEIFEMELTPNRGDCLSVLGLLRDLSTFYDVNVDWELYKGEMQTLNLNFRNLAPDACPKISFLKIDIQDLNSSYKEYLESYFSDLDINKNNFFTDISNYVSYEMGQPTHCYDANSLNDSFSLNMIDENLNFETLLGQKIKLLDQNLVFMQEKNILNLAGLMGGKSTSCSKNTKSVLVECAYFVPEVILGKSVKYDIKSDASHKFERGVDPHCHNKVLRRFVKIVEDHAKVVNIEFFSKEYKQINRTEISFDASKINNILGISLRKADQKAYLLKLGFEIDNDQIIVPSHRSDIKNQNDIAEEIARVIGYDNIKPQKLEIASNKRSNTLNYSDIRNNLTKNGFFEVINYPFVKKEEPYSISIDNPLDSNKRFLRTNVKDSLIENLLYNERRQKDSLKLFEISDIYYQASKKEIKQKKVLGIICSGRVGKNYLNFSKKIDKKYLKNILKDLKINTLEEPEIILRENLDTKLKNNIVYFEIELTPSSINVSQDKTSATKKVKDFNFIEYEPVSEFPSSYRDLSFSIKEEKKYYELQDLLLNYQNDLIKDIFVFDFYHNEKNNEIKIGFRFIFQSKIGTIKEEQVNVAMNQIINDALAIDKVTIPGLIKQ